MSSARGSQRRMNSIATSSSIASRAKSSTSASRATSSSIASRAKSSTIASRAKSSTIASPATASSNPYVLNPSPIIFCPDSPWCYDPFVYRMSYGTNVVEQTLVQEVFAERGWREYCEDSRRLAGSPAPGWNLMWRCTTLLSAPLRTLYSWQFTNQITGGIAFCNKAYLRHFILYLRRNFGAIADFGPTTFLLPNEWEALKYENSVRRRMKATPSDSVEQYKNLVLLSDSENKTKDGAKVKRRRRVALWITKPVGKSQGQGIVITGDLSSFHADVHTTTVVQEYIARPFLIGGYKFDLRLYACITCTNPLTVYVYHEGLARFATEPYDLKNLCNNFSHLTNATINKNGEHYSEDKEHIGFGCKWTLGQLRRHFASIGVGDFTVWQRIWAILVVTIIGDCNRITKIPFSKNHFGFLGYDILIDQDLSPYLLEVNLAPGLNADSDVDVAVKKPMLHHLFNLMGLPRPPRKRSTTTSTTTPVTRPEMNSPSVRNNYRPSTVGTAMSLNAPNMHEFAAGSNLRQRLNDMTEIYSQDLANSLSRLQDQLPQNIIKKRVKRKSKSSGPEPDMSSKKKTRVESVPTGPGREWGQPPAKSGGWHRIFPFDIYSHVESRNKMAEMDQRLMISRLYHYMDIVSKLVLAQPGQTDEFYVEYLKKNADLNTTIWFPRIPPEEPPKEDTPTSSGENPPPRPNPKI